MSVTQNSNELLTSKRKIVLEIDAFPFKGLQISEDWKKLDSVTNRSTCSMCKKSRKYFCYTCYVAVPEVQDIVPLLKLPVKVDIIKHAREMDGKSTAVHAAVLAPEDVRIFTYPCIPDYDPQENVVLVFPTKDAASVQEICERLFREVRPLESKRPCQDNRHSVVHRVVFIDSTWNQSRGIYKDPRIKALPSVVLKARLSQFWRHQADSPRWYLATIEAIHQFLVELDAAQWQLDHRTTAEGDVERTASTDTSDSVSEKEECSKSEFDTRNDDQKYNYNGKFDNLLFFFRFMYSKIHTLYDHEQLRSYKRRLE